MPKRIYCLSLIWTAALLLFFAGPIVAQLPPAATQDSEEGVDEKPKSSASLTASISPSGHAQVNFYATVDSSSHPDVRAALEKALECRLVLDSRTHRVSMRFDGSCEIPISTAALRHEGRIRIAPLAEYARSNNLEQLMISLYLPDTETFDSQPPITSQVPRNQRIPSKFLRKSERYRVYAWSLDSTLPEAIAFSSATSRVPYVAPAQSWHSYC